MESYPSAQEPFNNQSDNQSAIAQSATHNTAAAHTIHSAYKRHTQPAYAAAHIDTDSHRTHNQPSHNQDKYTATTSTRSTHAAACVWIDKVAI